MLFFKPFFYLLEKKELNKIYILNRVKWNRNERNKIPLLVKP